MQSRLHISGRKLRDTVGGQVPSGAATTSQLLQNHLGTAVLTRRKDKQLHKCSSATKHAKTILMHRNFCFSVTLLLSGQLRSCVTESNRFLTCPCFYHGAGEKW